MKISERTHPALNLLKNKQHFYYDETYSFVPKDKVVMYLNATFKTNLKQFKNNITFISSPFYEAMLKAYNSLYELSKSDINFNFSGTYINFIPGSGTVLYASIKKVKGDIDGDCVIFGKDELGVPSLIFAALLNKDKLAIIHNYNNLFNQQIASDIFHEIIFIELFKRYAKIETKNLKPHSRKKDINCKYINDTNYNILHLDSKWFTTLVKSDEFKVRGHFRLQPYKNDNGLWDKKLIWISDFMKHGYTSKARKLSFIDE